MAACLLLLSPGRFNFAPHLPAKRVMTRLPVGPASPHCEFLENKRHQRDRSLGAPGWQSVENLWDGGLKAPECRVVAIIEVATLRDLEGHLNSVFLGLF
jgi:hypothetical protein